ncbi:hypothetical protein JW921_03255 [Candidatus Fermentibacterales bacterium]|nr:hypothetical protein [Candidatus Fermentibacterales bacterium]
MRSVVTSLPALLLLLACGGPAATGRLSEDLDSTSMTIGVSGLALVRGACAPAMDLAELVRLAPGNDVNRLTVYCPSSQVEDVALAADTSPIPVEVVLLSEGGPRVVSEVEGLSWEPRYEWSITGSDCLFQGLVVLHNSTDQVWAPLNVDVLDEEERIAAEATGGLTLPPGASVVRWWQASGTVLEPHLVYGWPRLARWNILRPCVVRGAGPVLPRPGSLSTIWWPVVTGDTLWVEAEPGFLSLTEGTEADDVALQGAVFVENGTSGTLSIRVVYPELLPRGAVFIPGPDLCDSISLGPYETRVLHYSVTYSLTARRGLVEVDRGTARP